MNKFRIGQKARICDDGQTYPSYERMARFMKAKKWIKSSVDNTGKVGIIQSLEKHLTSAYIQIALLDTGFEEILIDIRGLRKISSCRRCFKRLKCITISF